MLNVEPAFEEKKEHKSHEFESNSKTQVMIDHDQRWKTTFQERRFQSANHNDSYMNSTKLKASGPWDTQHPLGQSVWSPDEVLVVTW